MGETNRHNTNRKLAKSAPASNYPAPRASLTIKDIAEMAGVSRATVSLAMNGNPKVNSKTREDILRLIEEVGYRPNQAARNLVNRKSGTILVILPKIDHVFSDVYFSECLSGIIEVTTQKSYHMMVDLATPDFKTECKALKLFQQGTVDGVVCVGNLNSDTYLIELFKAGCPLVLVNSSIGSLPRVIGDNVRAAEEAVTHLVELGHERIGHIRGPQSVSTALDRTTGYFSALKAAKIQPENQMIAEGYFDEASGYEATRWLLRTSKPPTALFTTNDAMAAGAVRALRQEGLSSPRDLALFGGDDIYLARVLQPTLSTICQSMDQMGLVACEQLFLQMEKKPYNPDVQVKLKLAIRESCGAVK